MNVLECSSKGDKRFSAFYAKVKFFGEFKSIEEHYQTAKCYLDETDNKIKQHTLKSGKGESGLLLKIGDKYYHNKYLTNFFDLLWLKYLDDNPSLVKVLAKYDDYNDIFKGKKTINCQADSIRKYMKQGRSVILEESKELILLMKNPFIVYEQDIFTSDANIIGHQTNCLGRMGGGIATTIKADFPDVFKYYEILCKKYEYKKNDLLGTCQVVEVDDNLSIANLFGQLDINQKNQPKINRTQYDKLEQALVTLRNKAMRQGKSVALPYFIGCGAACGDWSKVESIISKVFSVYPIILYKYKP